MFWMTGFGQPHRQFVRLDDLVEHQTLRFEEGLFKIGQKVFRAILVVPVSNLDGCIRVVQAQPDGFQRRIQCTFLRRLDPAALEAVDMLLNQAAHVVLEGGLQEGEELGPCQLKSVQVSRV